MTIKFTKEQIEKSAVSEINEHEYEKKVLKYKSGKITIGDKTFYCRSSWECNIAAYLEFLKNHGQLTEWEYEPYTFWFLKIMRGVRSYKPDFRITRLDGSQFYIEVKGFMDKKSATKLKRMKKYYPEIHIQIIDLPKYQAIKRSKAVYKGWGQLD